MCISLILCLVDSHQAVRSKQMHRAGVVTRRAPNGRRGHLVQGRIAPSEKNRCSTFALHLMSGVAGDDVLRQA